jgi:hypothetical protein
VRGGEGSQTMSFSSRTSCICLSLKAEPLSLFTSSGGRVPNMPFAFTIVDHSEGAATFDIRYFRDGKIFPIVVGTVCERRSHDWWEHLLRTASTAGITRRVAKPRVTPWLGVVLVPSLAQVIMSSDEAMCLAGLENAIAWTWLRRHEAGRASLS